MHPSPTHNAQDAPTDGSSMPDSPTRAKLVIDVTVSDALVIIPVSSWSTRSFCIVMPRVKLVPAASLSWIAEVVEDIQTECAA
jgi:hypothetical protein